MPLPEPKTLGKCNFYNCVFCNIAFLQQYNISPQVDSRRRDGVEHYREEMRTPSYQQGGLGDLPLCHCMEVPLHLARCHCVTTRWCYCATAACRRVPLPVRQGAEGEIIKFGHFSGLWREGRLEKWNRGITVHVRALYGNQKHNNLCRTEWKHTMFRNISRHTPRYSRWKMDGRVDWRWPRWPEIESIFLELKVAQILNRWLD